MQQYPIILPAMNLTCSLKMLIQKQYAWVCIVDSSFITVFRGIFPCTKFWLSIAASQNTLRHNNLGERPLYILIYYIFHKCIIVLLSYWNGSVNLLLCFAYVELNQNWLSNVPGLRHCWPGAQKVLTTALSRLLTPALQLQFMWPNRGQSWRDKKDKLPVLLWINRNVDSWTKCIAGTFFEDLHPHKCIINTLENDCGHNIYIFYYL